MLKNQFKKLREKIISIKDPISGYDKKIISKLFRLPNGIIENFFVDAGGDSVQIFAMTDDGMVLTVRQFRPGIEVESIELPGGGLEKGENPALAAKRELVEETGYEGDVHFIGKQSYSPYSMGERYMFVADNCKKIDRLDLDENEFLVVVKWPLEDFRKEIAKCTVRGSDTAYAGLDYLKKL